MDIEELQKRAGITEGEHFAKAVWNFERAMTELEHTHSLDDEGNQMAHEIHQLLTTIKRQLKVP